MSTISGITPPPTTPTPPAPPAEDPFRYGWREVPVRRADGRVDFDRIPLTLEDLLHPKMGDVMPQSTPHDRDIHYLKDVITGRVAPDPSAVVYHDVIIDWDDPELRHHSPDISVLFGVRNPQVERNSFHVRAEGVRPRVIVEVVSPDYRENDVVTKVEHYHRARVPCYVIVDREAVEGPVRLIGYRDRPDGYERLPLDNQGRLWVEPLGIWIGPGDNRIVCYDETGRELGDYVRVTQELEAALERADEEARLRADADRRATDADRRAAEEARLRGAADRRADDAVRARTNLEQQAEKDRARLRELEEELNRLRAATRPPEGGNQG
jgi:Uma2 family endonuclease